MKTRTHFAYESTFGMMDAQKIGPSGKGACKRREGGRPRGSGLTSCSPVCTTTNVSRRRRRALWFPPRQRLAVAEVSQSPNGALHVFFLWAFGVDVRR
jgi:hypothetical protein